MSRKESHVARYLRVTNACWQSLGAWLQRVPLQGACVAVGGLTLDSRLVATPVYVAGFNHLLQMLVFAFGLTLRKLFRRVRSCYPQDSHASNFCSGLRGVDTPPQ